MKPTKICQHPECAAPSIERTFRFLLKGRQEDHKVHLCEKHMKEMADAMDAALGMKGVRSEGEA